MRYLFTIVFAIFLVAMSAGCPGPGPVTIKTQIVFSGTYFPNTFPASMVTVHLSSANAGTVDTMTDFDGNLSATFPSDPGTVQYIITLNNSAFTFTNSNDCDAPPINLQGSISNVPPAQFRIDLSRWVDAAIWRELNKVNKVAVEDLGRNMQFIKVCYAVGHAYNPTKQTLQINPSTPFLTDTVYHEYGHAIMQQAVGSKYNNVDCQRHQIRIVESPSCAWVEGWANFYAVRTDLYYYPGNTPSFQTNSVELYTSPVIGLEGYKDEGRVAAALWDIYDQTNDASIDPSYGNNPDSDANVGDTIEVSTMLIAMNGLSYNNDARAFWDLLRQNDSVSVSAFEKADSIMRYNWIVPKPQITVTPLGNSQVRVDFVTKPTYKYRIALQELIGDCCWRDAVNYDSLPVTLTLSKSGFTPPFQAAVRAQFLDGNAPVGEKSDGVTVTVNP